MHKICSLGKGDAESRLPEKWPKITKTCHVFFSIKLFRSFWCSKVNENRTKIDLTVALGKKCLDISQYSSSQIPTFLTTFFL